jgi:hypothetical protein
MNEQERLFSDEDLDLLLMRFIASSGSEGMERDEIDRLLLWAENSRFNAHLLNLVMEGRVQVRWPDGFDTPKYRAVAKEG